MNEYQRQKLSEKIAEGAEKAQLITQGREELLAMRKDLRREIEHNKKEILEKFEKAKRHKSEAFGSTMPGGDEKPRKNMYSTIMLPDSSRTHYDGKDRMHTNSNTGTYSSAANLHAIPTITIEPIAITKPSPKKKQVKHAPGTVSEPGIINVPEKEVRKILEDLRATQNHDMLRALEEEQRHEAEREEKTRAINDQVERKKIEKLFAIDRMNAQQRILKLQTTHEEALRQVMTKYGMKNL